MPDFISLSCPSCGAKLQIGNDLERFACAHCGNEHVVRREGGVISLAPVIEQLKGIRAGVDKTASELAIKRIKEEISSLENKRDSIKGTGCLSSIFSGSGCLWIVGLVFFAALLLGNLHDQSAKNWVLLFIILGVLALIGMGIFDYTSEQEASQEREKVFQQITEKQKELEKHQQIVSDI